MVAIAALATNASSEFKVTLPAPAAVMALVMVISSVPALSRVVSVILPEPVVEIVLPVVIEPLAVMTMSPFVIVMGAAEPS